MHVLGSFIFGLPTDTADTFAATAELAQRSGVSFAQFVMLTPFPGTVDFEKWAAHDDNRERQVHGVPITRHWLIPNHQRPKLYSPHPVMSLEDIRAGTQSAWDRFYSWRNVWARSRVRWLGLATRRLFLTTPMPQLQVPEQPTLLPSDC